MDGSVMESATKIDRWLGVFPVVILQVRIFSRYQQPELDTDSDIGFFETCAKMNSDLVPVRYNRQKTVSYIYGIHIP